MPVSNDELKGLYYYLTLVRTTDERCRRLFKQGRFHGTYFSAVGQEECARFIAERQIPLGRLLTHRFALDQAAEAYRLFDTQTTGKGVFVF